MNLQDKQEVQKIVKQEVQKIIDNKLDLEFQKKIKTRNTKTRDELVKLIKDSIESVYKVLWQKRDFWKSDIK